ncbi:ComEC/Rec2 family competence protein [bacterium]|nr:ComEC/Rec2 family competence protein [bacterium]
MEKNLFLQIGIYHWIVASGGHLIFLQTFIEKIGLKNSKIVFLFLLIFTLVCGFQPPIARSFISLFIAQFSKKHSLFLTRNQTTICAGLLTLLLFPQWYCSMSFQLSWLTALAFNNSQSDFVKCFMVSIFLVPLSRGWSARHLLYNVFLTPIFSHFLFPMTFIFFALAPWTLIGNQVWDFIFYIMALLPSQNLPLTPMPSFFIWSYLFLIQTFLLFQKEGRHS